MFKNLANETQGGERLEIFNMLKFHLALGRRLAEFLVLAVLIAAGPMAGRSTSWLTAALTIALLFLAASFPRWLFSAAEEALIADFGLDRRLRRQRLAALAVREAKRLAVLLALSWLLFWGLTALELWAWTLAAVALGVLALTLAAFRPRLFAPASLRPVQEGEMRPELQKRLALWSAQMNLKAPALRINSSFNPYLAAPRLTGLGPTLTLEIPEKALACFPPRSLSLLTTAALMEGLLKNPLKLLFLRLCALFATGSLAAILIGTLGRSLWLYPLIRPPALLVLVWLAGWLGLHLAEFSGRLLRRNLEVQLIAASALILKDEEAADLALNILAARNLEEENPPAWQEIFRSRFSRAEFLKRYRVHLQNCRRQSGENRKI